MSFESLDRSASQYVINLIDNGISEGKTLDYKKELHLDKPSEKKEFLADVSSFANTEGGWLIFGVEEEGGKPKKVCGIEVDDEDELKQKINNLLLTGVETKITGVTSNFVTYKGKRILALHIPRSYLKPHRVTLEKDYRFYARNDSGKYLMDVDELRLAFTASEQWADRIRRFREERLATLLGGDYPSPLFKFSPPWYTLHIVSYGAFSPGRNYPLPDFYKHSDLMGLVYNYFPNYSPNADGAILWRKQENMCEYLQLFRNGVVEFLGNECFETTNSGLELHLNCFEETILEYLKMGVPLLQQLGVESPLAVFITLCGVRGCRIHQGLLEHLKRNPEFLIRKEIGAGAITREVLFIPEVVIENYASLEPDKLLRPCFDVLWNAFGFPGSPNYDQDGKRKIKGI
ncbi:MAG: hypothetical protein PWP60_1348 [Candidatus Atribacteria bacterium]|jgi:hypothetical protein|uniref:AlbA family DNA-binding domain-containing protein n=1 Tax=Atrimonas thermophila TaxID=3064161 RepID=UPI0024AAC21B|nr:hypothetical protein [Candidatus Atribacteria bacterium]